MLAKRIGLSEQSFVAKMHRVTDFRISEMRVIQASLKNLPLDYLFEWVDC